MRPNLFGGDGLIHTAPKQSDTLDKPKEVDRESIEVCLNCTLKKCKGSPLCYKERKAMQKEK